MSDETATKPKETTVKSETTVVKPAASAAPGRGARIDVVDGKHFFVEGQQVPGVVLDSSFIEDNLGKDTDPVLTLVIRCDRLTLWS